MIIVEATISVTLSDAGYQLPLSSISRRKANLYTVCCVKYLTQHTCEISFTRNKTNSKRFLMLLSL